MARSVKKPQACHYFIYLSIRYPLSWRVCLEIPGYGGTTRPVRVLSECCLWYTQGEPPVAIRWVLVVDPTGQEPPMAVFSTDLDRSAESILARFVLRWNVEVTFEETRRHLVFHPT